MSKKILLVLTGLVRLGLALLLLSAAQLAAQEAQDGAAGEDEEEASEAERELERKAVGLLEETVREADALKLAENRLRVQTVALALLWPRDEAAARELFRRAAEGVAALIAETDPSDPYYHNERNTIFQLRQQLVSTAAAYDAKLALEFLRATRQPAPYSYPDAEYKQADQELNLETQLAAQVAAQDTKQALRMAEESLGRGVSQGVTNVFHQLAQKDKEAAARLAAEIIRRLRAEEIVRDYESSSVAVALLNHTRGTAQTPAPATTAEKSGKPTIHRIEVANDAASKVVIDEGARRQLVETLVAAALLPNAPRNTGILQMVVQGLLQALPEVERYAPASVAALKRRAETAGGTDPRARAWKEYNEMMQGATTVEAMLELAPKVSHELRDQLYTNVAYRVLGESNDLERARAIAENIASPERRAQLLRDLERQHRMTAAQRGEPQGARQLVARMKGVDEKVQLLTQIATMSLGRGDKATAREMLEEARSLVGRGETSQQFYALFNVAHVYAQLDESVTYEMMGFAVERLNELMAAAVVVNGFGQDAFKEGELRQQGGYMWHDLIGRCAQELANLANTDFDRARTLAQRFDRADARALAQLLFAQGILEQIVPANQDGPQNLPRGRVIRGSVTVGRGWNR